MAVRKRRKEFVKGVSQVKTGEARTVTDKGAAASGRDRRIYPAWAIHVILFFVVVTRLKIVSSKQSWWILHPDEVFQSLEVAHSEVYGYGFRPYEFFEPPSPGQHRSSSEQQHLELGMYSLRSWLLPRFFALLFAFKETLGIPLAPFEFAKLVCTSITALLPVAVVRTLRMLKPSLHEDVIIIASILIGFSDCLVLLGTHTLVNSLLSPLLFFCVSAFFWIVRKYPALPKVPSLDNNYNEWIPSPKDGIIRLPTGVLVLQNRQRISCSDVLILGTSSCILGILTYLRPDSFILLTAINLAFFYDVITTCRNLWTAYAVSLFGGSVGVFYGAFDDYVSYGKWFLSPVQWTKFQLNNACKIFGSQKPDFYWEELFLKDYLMLILLTSAIVLAVLFVSCTFMFRNDRSSVLWLWYLDYYDTIILALKFFACASLLLTFYSLQSHKEVRFIHDAVVLLLCGGSASVYVLYHLLLDISKDANISFDLVYVLRMLIWAESLLCIIRGAGNYPVPGTMPGKIVTTSHLESADVNACLHYISRQKDVTGVVIDYSIHWTGGYTILHKNVPLIAKTHYEFREWSLPVRQESLSRSYVPSSNGNNISLATLDRVSDFITVENGLYVIRKVAENPEYNYVVVTSSRKFPDAGFRAMFQTGNSTVYKRLRTRSGKEFLASLSTKIPIGKNSTILQYEASWLLTFDLPQLARERLQKALEIDQNCVRCWQLLYIAAEQLKLPNSSDIAEECYRQLGRETCQKPTNGIVLHPEYRLRIHLPLMPFKSS